MQGRVVLGKYTVERLLGRGSMGQVHLAKPKAGGSDVVVKFISDKLAHEPRFQELFARELAMMARFKHPHAVELLDGGIDQVAGPCIVMEYVPGPDLQEAIHLFKRFDAERTVKLVVPLCQALNAAHSAGIIHRDLKPANIKLLHAGEPKETIKVMDLGLAALADKPYIPVEKLQGAADVYAVGSPAYMAPEQVRGDSVDHRADIYSLGIVLYEMLTGRLPFDIDDVARLLAAHTSQEPPKFAMVGIRDVSPRVEAVVMQCLEKYPNERPATMFEVAKKFKLALAHLDVLNPMDFEPKSANTSSAASTGPAPPVGSTVNRIVQTLDAWMPEAIAVVKLRGFLDDISATLLTSEPGLIRVRLGDPPAEPKRGLLGWFRKPTPPTEIAPIAPILVDLFLTKKAGTTNKIEVTIVFQALEGPLPDDPRWHKRVKKLFNDLRGYLMAQR